MVTLKSATGLNKQAQTIVNDDKHLPVAVFNNALPAQIAYGFNLPDVSFVPTGTLSGNMVINGKAGFLNGLSFTSSNTFSKALIKYQQVAGYTFSIWIKAATGGSFNITATSVSATQTVPLTYQASADWKYYQVNIPLSNFIPGSFTLSFTVNSGMMIDGDMMAYPQQATVAINEYDKAVTANYPYKIMETNNNGISTYYSRDNLGRVIYTCDQDKQIISKNSYKYNSSSIIPQPIFYIDVPVGVEDIYKELNYTFKLYNSFETCLLQGATYTWNYGDGTASTTSSTHTFAQAGTYNVTLTIAIPGKGTTTSTTPVVVLTPPPPPVYLFFMNNTAYDNNTGTYEYTLDRLEFYQGGVIVQVVYASDIVGSYVPAGSYTVKAYCSGTFDGKNIVATVDSNTVTCKIGSHTNVNTFSINNATQSLDITLNPTTCN
jgi:hypothetical protein